MSIQALNKAQSFRGGSDLWVVPNEIGAVLFKKMDWYLNFQITGSKQHQSLELSPTLKSILEENEISNPISFATDNSPLMIVANEYLPTQILVQIPFKQDHEKWMKAIFSIWQQLKSPTIRVFLPQNMTHEDFKSSWPQLASEVTTVETRVN